MKPVALLLVLLACAAPIEARAQRAVYSTEYDDYFRKYSKRFFGPGFDWQYFKAQALAESGLDPTARSPVGARGLMQLMPGTYSLIKSNRPELGAIDDPEWNIAAGIMHSRGLWHRWKEHPTTDERLRFMFGSYNAGEGPILRARGLAHREQLDHLAWSSIEQVAPKVQRWRYRETLPYVRRIEDNHRRLSEQPRRVNAPRGVSTKGSASKAAAPKNDSTGSATPKGNSAKAGAPRGKQN